MPVFSRIMIANRGEIAVRIIKTAKKMGITTVAVHTSDESDALHVRMADEAVELRGSHAAGAYLDIKQIISLASQAEVQAIHPGYGFLSENPGFAAACEKEGIIFIGPRSETIALMGNKIRAREAAASAGLPVTSGFTGSPEELLTRGQNMKFPLLVKASAGGGGRGMRQVSRPDQLSRAIEEASREARTFFGDGSVYLEEFLEDPRHIEVQVIGDSQGNVIHLFERECSIQRRYQKIIEESPSPSLSSRLRREMTDAAVRLSKSIGYRGAGTVEFLTDAQGNYYFLEMNTRLQVEHPVTEVITGIDIVREQINIASGLSLGYDQDHIKKRGHAIECRIYAENPESGFQPSPGNITCYHEPEGSGIRVDSSCDSAGPVNGNYDPLIAKVTSAGRNREEARNRMISALEDYALTGITTNTGFLLSLLRDEDFQSADFSTTWCEKNTPGILERMHKLKEAAGHWRIPAAGALVASLDGKTGRNPVWEGLGYWRIDRELKFLFEDKPVNAMIRNLTGNSFRFLINNEEVTGKYRIENSRISLSSTGGDFQVFSPGNGSGQHQIFFKGFEYLFLRTDMLEEKDFDIESGDAPLTGPGAIYSPMPGRVVRVNKATGDKVKKGEVLAVVESMKMENNIEAPSDGIIGSMEVREGELTDGLLPLLILDPSPQ